MTAITEPPPVASSPEELAPWSPRWRMGLWAVFGLLLALGAVGLGLRLVSGHAPAGYGSYVPWGLWIAVYFHGVGIAAGVFAVTCAGYLLRLRGFSHPNSLRVGAILVAATVGPALLAVGLDLGRMERAWRIIVSPSFTSMMAFNSWTYLAFLAVAATVWALSLRPDRGWLKPFLVLALLLSVMVPSQSGAFVGVVDAKPYWNTALLPLLMLVSAITAGAATLLVVRGLMARLGDAREGVPRDDAAAALRLTRWVVLVGLITYFGLEFAEFSTEYWSPGSEATELSLILTGPYWWVFWLVHVGLGGIVPLALLATRRPTAWMGAGALVAVTFVSARLNVLIPGQAVSELEGLQEAFFHPRLDYLYDATLMEYLVVLFVVALGMAIFYLGLRITTAVEQRTRSKESVDASH